MKEKTYFQRKEQEYYDKIWKTLEELIHDTKPQILKLDKGQRLEKELKEWGYINHCVEKEKEEYKFHNDEWVY